ncbi:hypothetical protein [Nocardiopsis oceani]
MPTEAISVQNAWKIVTAWTLRLAALVTVPWALWTLLPAHVTVIVTIALAVLSALFLGPQDTPWRPLRVPGITVVLWDLLLVTLVAAALYLLGSPHAVVYLMFLPVLLGACRIAGWREATNGPQSTSQRLLALGTAAVLIAGLLSPRYHDTAEQARVCALASATPGSGELWPDASEPTGETDPDHFVGPALWTVSERENIIAGHGDTVTSALGPGLAVRSAEDGEVLWHVDTRRLEELNESPESDSFDANRVHQVGDTVVVGYRTTADDYLRAHLVGYDAATGRMSWCVPGLRDVMTDPQEPSRFLARDTSSAPEWGLYDPADASRVARLPLNDDPDHGYAGDPRAVLAEGRATVWTPRGFTSYDSDSGDLLALAPALHPGFEDRDVVGLVHVDDITVLSFAAEGDSEVAHERYAVAAHDAEGDELWNSEGTGPLVEGEPLVGTGFGACYDLPKNSFGAVTHRGFDGHFISMEIPASDRAVHRTAAVRASDGTVTWITEDDLFIASCDRIWHSADDRLHLDSGAVLDAEGIVTEPENENKVRLVVHTANGVSVRETGRGPATFHALP